MRCFWRPKSIRTLLEEIADRQQFNHMEIKMALADLQASFDVLKAKVETLDSTVDGAEALLVDIKGKLDAALANAPDFATLQQSVSDLATVVGDKTTELAAAVAANTPGA